MTQPLEGIGSNVDYIGSTYPWADQQTTAVAASAAPPGDTSTIDQTMQSIQDSLTSTWDGVVHSFSDPVLAQKPTTGMRIQQFVSGNLGQLPVAGDSIQKYQQSMQNEGLGTGLVADGAWTPAWQSINQQMVNELKSNQIAGQEAGSVKTSSAAHNIFHAISPTGIFDAVSGFVKSIPADTRSVIADTVAGFANAPHAVAQLAQGHLSWQNVAGAIPLQGATPFVTTASGQNTVGKAPELGAAIESIGRRSTETPAQFAATQNVHQALNDMNTVLSIASAAGFAKSSVKAIGENVARGVLKSSAEELQRSPGLIARTLWAARTPEQLAADQEVAPKLLGAKWVNNVPVLGRLAPLPQKLAEGWSYGVRTALARPYAYPVVRAAGQAFGRGQLAGLALHGEAAVTPGLQQSNAVESDNTADVLNAKWDAAQRKLIGFSPLDMNLLQGVLHAPVGDLSGAVGGFSRQIVRGFDDSLGQRNVQQSFERALKTNDAGLLEQFGGDRAALDTWMHQETVKYAGDLWAQAQVSDIPQLAPHTPDWDNAIGAMRQHFWGESLADPTFANRAVAQMMDNDVNGEQFTHRIIADWQKIADDPKAHLQNSLADLMTGQRIMQQGHLDGHWDSLITPQDIPIVRNAADTFDHDGTGALGQAQPEMPRRTYVTKGNGLVKQINTHVAYYRKVAARNVTAAQKASDDAKAATYATSAEARAARSGATNALNAAKQRALDVETHAAAGNHTRMIAAAAGHDIHPLDTRAAKLSRLRGQLSAHIDATQGFASDLLPKAIGSGVDYDALVADAAKQVTRAQNLADKGEPGADRILSDALRRQADVQAKAAANSKGVKFNDLYTQAHGPRQPLPADFGSQAMRLSLNPRLPGAIGMRNLKKTVSMQAALNQATKYERQIAGVTTVDEATALTSTIRKYLFENFDMASPELSAFDGQPQKLVNLLRDRAKQLGADLVMDPQAPQGAKDWLEQLHKAGYHPVIGQHVGHQYDGSLPNLDNIAGGRTLQRRIAEKLGLNPIGVRDQDIGRAQKQAEITGVSNRLRDSDKARLATAQINAKTIVDVVHAPGFLGTRELGWERAIKAATDETGVNKSAVDQLMASEDMTRPEALNAMKAESNRLVSPRDVPVKKLRAALAKTQEVHFGDGTSMTWQGLDPRIPEQKEATNLIIRGLMDGQRLPSYMMGWQAIENWGRAGFGFLGAAAAKAPGSNFLTNVANWPNNIVRLRNSLRFNFNPLFAARLVTKTKLKMNLEGLQYHWNALDHLGADAPAAMRDTKRIVGGVNDEATNADLLAQKAGVWGIFHRDWTKADAVRQLQALGKSDAEIKSTVNRIFKYGPEDGTGTSALERSANTIFFPFSFEKTVMRNTGQYLLEHPGQSLILSAAINEYRKYDKNGQVGQWVQDHAPILDELNQLNAFSHGISPGQFGGINRQLLNLFLPQSWGGGHTAKNMQTMLPVFTDFNKLLKSVGDQSDVLRNVADNAVQYLHQKGAHDPLTPYRPMGTDAAQQYDAGKMRAQFILALGPVLQANASASTGDKQTWPVSASLPASVSGQPINRTTISYLVQKFYPAYNPSASSIRFENDQVKMEAYINAQPPAEGAKLMEFNKAAAVVAGHLSNNDYDEATQADVQGAFQQAAQAASKSDPTFYKYYNTYWAWSLGPLETVPKVGS